MSSSLFSNSFFSRHSYRQVLVLAAMLIAVVAASAQDSAKDKPKPYALLFGTMWGANNRPLPGVMIHIRRVQDKKARWTLVSNNEGEFAQRVPTGTQDYVVWADIKHIKGAKPAKPVEATVHVENDERVDFGLHLRE